MIRFFVFIVFFIGTSILSIAQPVSLKDSLTLYSSKLSAKQTEAERALYASEINVIVKNGLLSSAKNQKDKVNDFTLMSSKGTTVSLYSELEKGPVILLWFRGSWSPYCTLTLRYMQRLNKDFLANGATVFALSSQKKEKNIQLQQRYKLTFPLLSDTGNAVARSFGLVYPISDELSELYEKDFKVSTFYSTLPKEFSIVGLYIIHPSHKIVYSFLEPDYKKRAEPSDLMRVLKGMMFPARKP